MLAVSLFIPVLIKHIKSIDGGGSYFRMGLISSTYGAFQLFSSPTIVIKPIELIHYF